MGDLGLRPSFASCYLVELRQVSLGLSFLICETRGPYSPTGLLRGSIARHPSKAGTQRLVCETSINVYGCIQTAGPEVKTVGWGKSSQSQTVPSVPNPGIQGS